jgi:hypothetical protein
VILTVAEADAVVQLPPDSAFAIRAIEKIRTALGQTIAATLSVPPNAVELPPLRAKRVRGQWAPYRMAKATHPRVATAPGPAAAADAAKAADAGGAPPPLVDVLGPVPAFDLDYVPFRDEAGGAYT